MNQEAMDKIKEYLEFSYSGAKLMGDTEGMLRISRAMAALEADINKEIFTEEFLEIFYSKNTTINQTIIK